MRVLFANYNPSKVFCPFEEEGILPIVKGLAGTGAASGLGVAAFEFNVSGFSQKCNCF